MPYAPGVTDISGQFLAAGIGGAADRISEGIDKYRLTAKEISHLKGATEFAAQQGLLSAEDLAAFEGGNLAKKREIGIRAGMLYSDAQEKQKLTLQRDELAALNTYRMGSLGIQAEGQRLSAANAAATQKYHADLLAMQKAEQDAVLPVKVEQIKAQTYNMANGDPVFNLTPEEVAAYGQAGAVPLRVSRGAYNVMPAAGGDAKAPQFVDMPLPDGRVIKVAIEPDGTVKQLGGNPRAAAAKPMDVTTAGLLGSLTSTKTALEKELADHTANIANGDERYGMLNAYSRKARVEEISTKLAGINAQLEGMGGVPSPAAGGAGAGTAAPVTVQGADANGAPVALPPLPDQDPAPLPALGEVPQVATPDEVKAKLKSGELKSGDWIRTPDGRLMQLK